MAGSSSDDYGVGRSLEGFSRGQHCQSGEALAEWRLCEQVDNGTPSTSPPYWDTDDGDDNDGGEKPSELYGKYTWKIEKFSQTSKRELKSEVFEVGSYKWYILIYPQGCDVCNHLSLFLCVANHDKLLPGWSHFAQFTIAVVNKDPKKSKYSDTLHRFCKKEHDWGWKKFMELSKVQDGFIVADTLEIRAQVQVIREKVHRPFRCLDRQYRRELVRVYLTNVEQICRRFVEERRGKLGKLFEDKVRWSSFCSYWLGVDQYIRNHLSREKTDVILRVVVKQFFVEKEVTSTLVMDSLNSGLKALECQSKSKKGRANLLDSVETSAPIVRVENDMFVLVDDVLPLLERAALEPLPPKDEKGPQNRTKDGSSGQDFSKDSIERDERRLTELGRRTLEIFVLAHIFSNRIEIAFQEAVALKRQEELIREEEASGQAENEQKARRRVAEKEKRAKKKLNKQRRSSRKGKDRDKDEKCDVAVQNKNQRDIPIDERTEENSVKLAQSVPEQPNALEDVSDVSDIGDDVGETLPADSVDRDASPVTWETDTSEIHPSMEACSSGMSSLPVQHGQAEQSPSSMDDSSSTCSTDSVPSVVTNGPYKGNMQNDKSQTSPSRGKNRGGKETHEQTSLSLEMDNQLFDPAMRTGHQNVASRSCSSAEPESKTVLLLKDQIQRLEQHLVEKEENVVSLEKKLSDKDQVDVDRLSKQTMAAEASASPRSHTINFPSIMQLKSVQDRNAVSVSVREEPSTSPPQTDKTVHLMKQQPQIIAMSKSDVQKTTVSKPVSMQIENPTTHQVPVMSRPSSAPLVPGPRSTASTISMVQTAPSLSQSMSEAGRLGSKPSPATHSYVSHSCRNAIMGKTRVANVAGFVPSSSSVANPLLAYSQPTAWVPSPRSSVRTDQGFTFGSVTPEVLHSQPQWTEGSQWHARATLLDSSLLSVPQDLGLYGPRSSGSQTDFADEFPSSVSARQAQRVSEDEFPHLDIINYLLDEELGNGKAANEGAVSQSPNNGYHHPLSPPFTFPNDMRMLPEMGSAINLCRFERPVAYHDDEIRPVYGSFNSHINGPSDAALQIDFSLYGNQQIDGVIQNQWPVGFGSDLSLLGDAYPFHMPEYSNLACGVNGYTVFQSSNGH